MIIKYLKKLKKNIKEHLLRFEYRNLSSKEVFEKIYDNKEWNRNSLKINSGPGSHEKPMIGPYIKFVSKFLKKSKLRVLDLGCGDFNIGKEFYKLSSSYLGIDIVESVIKSNKIRFHNQKLDFLCLDIINDDLPNADCVIIRQVLQHLDNKSIKKILKKLDKYKFLIITEHIPDGEYNANIDKSINPLIRLEFNSGINLEKEPFNIKYKIKEELILKDSQLGGVHKTVLYTVF